jgi:hypothetical protein
MRQCFEVDMQNFKAVYETSFVSAYQEKVQKKASSL